MHISVRLTSTKCFIDAEDEASISTYDGRCCGILFSLNLTGCKLLTPGCPDWENEHHASVTWTTESCRAKSFCSYHRLYFLRTTDASVNIPTHPSADTEQTIKEANQGCTNNASTAERGTIYSKLKSVSIHVIFGIQLDRSLSINSHFLLWWDLIFTKSGLIPLEYFKRLPTSYWCNYWYPHIHEFLPESEYLSFVIFFFFFIEQRLYCNSPPGCAFKGRVWFSLPICIFPREHPQVFDNTSSSEKHCL